MIVVDAAVLVSAIARQDADGRWSRSEMAQGDLAAPWSVLVESDNTLRQMELKGRLSTAEAAAAYSDLLDAPISLFPFIPYANRIWRCAGT